METQSIRAPGLTAKRAVPKNAPLFFFLHTPPPPPPSRAASLAVPIRINASARDAAVILRWSPSPRAACPGALAKYLICHVAEGDNVTCEWDPPVPMGQEGGGLPPGYCRATACSLSFAQMLKQMPRRRTSPSKTYGPAQPTGWEFGR